MQLVREHSRLLAPDTAAFWFHFPRHRHEVRDESLPVHLLVRSSRSGKPDGIPTFAQDALEERGPTVVHADDEQIFFRPIGRPLMRVRFKNAVDRIEQQHEDVFLRSDALDGQPTMSTLCLNGRVN
jgi:hypothetical protein